MTELITSVYLNEGPMHFSGFHNAQPPQLHAASSFTLALPERPCQEDITAALTTVFRELNIDEPTTEWAQQYRQAGHRSPSVRDVIVICETAWACAPFGWTLINADDLTAAIYH